MTDAPPPKPVDPDHQPSSNRSKILADAETHRRAWDHWHDSDEERLIGLVIQGATWPVVAKELGRTPNAVQSRARRLALTRVFGREIPEWTPRSRNQAWTYDEVTQLLDLVVTAPSWEAIGTKLGRTPASCRRRAEAIALDRLRTSDDPLPGT